jgi:hypothetical protein
MATLLTEQVLSSMQIFQACVVETCDSLLVFSSEQLNLGLEQEVIDVKGDVGDSEDENLDSKQENLARDKLCGLQCEGRQREQSENCSFKFIDLIY